MESYKSQGIKLNLSQMQCIIFLAMLYMSVMLCNMILTNKWIKIGDYFVFGGAFISPLLFILGDIIAEIFGYKTAKQIIIFGFICQTLFAIAVELIIATPAPINWHQQAAYSYTLGSLVRIDLSGVVAFLVSSLINIRFIAKWKVMVMGRYFWLRSIGSSTIAEACYSALAIVMIAFGSLPSSTMFSIILITFLIKFAYSIALAYPGNLLVSFIKYRFQVDVYDSNFNSFSFFRMGAKKINKKLMST